MTEYYSEYTKFFVALDSIIFGFSQGELKLLLQRRKFEPAKGQWSLFGGFLQENESLDEAAYRILNQLTGIEKIYLKQLYSFGEAERDPGERVISVAYYSLIRIDEFKPRADNKDSAYWFPINELPGLIFDHSQMVEKGLQRLRRDARIMPIGFELLPREFTMPQLQSLYEAVYQTTLDKRNFRKKILSMGFLQRLDKKDKTGSKRGAFLYKFDKIRYKEMTSNGFRFEI